MSEYDDMIESYYEGRDVITEKDGDFPIEHNYMDLDVHQIVKALLANEDNQTKTPLLRDIDTGDNYVIQNIYEDEDEDIIIEIKYL